MVTPITSSAVQVHEPRRWPRTVSCMRWTSTRPTRPRVMQSATPMLSRRHRSSGAKNAVQPRRGRLRAIRKAWHGKAMRKSCAAQAVSCEGSAKAPVTGFIAMLAAAAVFSTSRSGSCSLWGASFASRSMEPRLKTRRRITAAAGLQANPATIEKQALFGSRVEFVLVTNQNLTLPKRTVLKYLPRTKGTGKVHLHLPASFAWSPTVSLDWENTVTANDSQKALFLRVVSSYRYQAKRLNVKQREASRGKQIRRLEASR
eukprot:scaffold23077_cov68-Phaeocystis_antarctica.AAC.1